MNLTSKQMAEIMIRTGTSKTDLFSKLNIFTAQSNDMIKGKIKVSDEVSRYLIGRLHANK